MNTNQKKTCCQGCKKGQPGTNSACNKRLMLQKLEEKQQTIKSKES